MAQGNRKRSNKKEAVVKQAKRDDVKPLTQMEATIFQRLVETSNQYGKLEQQFAQYKMIKDKLKERRVKIQKGEIKLPIQVQLSQNMFYAESDKKEVLKILDEQIKTLGNSIKGIEGQLKNFQDGYIEQGLQLKTFIDKKYGIYEVKAFANRGVQASPVEKTLFEGEFDKLISDEKMQAEFEEAKKRAVKENKKIAKAKK